MVLNHVPTINPPPTPNYAVSELRRKLPMTEQESKSLRDSCLALLYTPGGSGCSKKIFRKDPIVRGSRVIPVGDDMESEDSIAERSLRTVPGDDYPSLLYFGVYRTRGVVARMLCLWMTRRTYLPLCACACLWRNKMKRCHDNVEYRDKSRFGVVL